jgi:glutamate 5-kinase
LKKTHSTNLMLDDGSKPSLLVLKVGTSTLMMKNADGSQRVRLRNVASLVELIAVLKKEGKQVVLVSSGAVGMGLIKLGIPKPSDLRKKQAVAAAGQSQLMRMYEDLFGTVGLQCAQLLISQSDFLDKTHWRNVKHTIVECLKLGVVPVINENDSTNTEELRFGDNDNLASLTAVQLEADWLFLFTDVDYLYTANPRTNPDAKALRVIEEPWSLEVNTADAGSGFGTGGMSTKIVAARTASTAGIPCGMINGEFPERVHSFLRYAADAASGPPDGTFFNAMQVVHTVSDRRRWILSLPVAGTLIIDDGAARAVGDRKSLLPAGVWKVEGTFLRNEAVRLVHRGRDVARALVEMSAEELKKVRGKNSAEFEDVLGYAICAEACNRNHTILTVAAESLRTQDVIGRLPDSQMLRRASASDAPGSSDRTARSADR